MTKYILILLMTLLLDFKLMAQTNQDIPVPAEGWQLIWHDEFDGDQLNTDDWNTVIIDMVGAEEPRHHNDQYAQYIMDDDVIVSDSLLRLRAQKRTVRGTRPPRTYDYTAGWVSTRNKFSFLYGYVEIRARYPAGSGMWPAFWMMSDDGQWGPEWDIAEFFGNQSRMHMGLMYTAWPEVRWDSQSFISDTWTEDWHTYALEWLPGQARFLVDGEVYRTLNAEYIPAESMYIILQNGVGTDRSSAGVPDENTIFPNYLDVDYIRVYQRDAATYPLIQNAGFEAGLQPAFWDVSPDARPLLRSPHSGRLALRLRPVEGAYGQQTISNLQPDTTYRLTAWGRVDQAGETLAFGARGHSEQIISDSEYTQAAVTFTTASDETSAIIYCQRGPGTGDAYCDDFELVRVD